MRKSIDGLAALVKKFRVKPYAGFGICLFQLPFTCLKLRQTLWRLQIKQSKVAHEVSRIIHRWNDSLGDVNQNGCHQQTTDDFLRQGRKYCNK